MSRYDYPDPGQDPNYCDGLGGHPEIARTCSGCGETAYVGREMGYQVQVFCDRCIDRAPIDPAEHAAHAALDVFQTIEVELAKCSTPARAEALRRIADVIFKQADRVALAATSKLEDLAS